VGVYAAIALSVGIGWAVHGYADGVNHSQRLTKPGPSSTGRPRTQVSHQGADGRGGSEPRRPETRSGQDTEVVIPAPFRSE